MGNAANIVFLTVYESDLWEPKWNMTKGWLEIIGVGKGLLFSVDGGKVG
jgi:hypothetical protein